MKLLQRLDFEVAYSCMHLRNYHIKFTQLIKFLEKSNREKKKKEDFYKTAYICNSPHAVACHIYSMQPHATTPNFSSTNIFNSLKLTFQFLSTLKDKNIDDVVEDGFRDKLIKLKQTLATSTSQ